ncbi:hypothetical protein GCM10010980_07550 [Corynebacterium marinum]|nr:hypothetical protein GCM10010980_07550 [Corynebacterium marinum]
MKESAPATMKIGWSVAAKDCCGQRDACAYTVIAGPAMPARVFMKPPAMPATTAGTVPSARGMYFLPKVVTARAMRSRLPTKAWRREPETSRTRRAAGTAPTTRTEAMTANLRQSTYSRTVAVVAAALKNASTLTTRMPSTGPIVTASTGPAIRPRPMPEIRCMAEPTATMRKMRRSSAGTRTDYPSIVRYFSLTASTTASGSRPCTSPPYLATSLSSEEEM